MVREAAELPGMVGIGHLAVGDEVLAVDRDQVLDREVGRELGRRAVHRVGHPGADVRPRFVLDPDAAGVHVAVAGVPGLVLLAHHLRDVAVARADDVVRRPSRGWVAEPLERSRVRALGGVDDDHVDRPRKGPVRPRVVRGRRRQPVRLRVVGRRRGPREPRRRERRTGRPTAAAAIPRSIPTWYVKSHCFARETCDGGHLASGHAAHLD